MLKFIFDMGLWLASNSPEHRLHVWIIPDRSMVSTLRPRENGHRFTKVVLKTVACVVVQNRPQAIIWTNDIAPSLTLRRKITISKKQVALYFEITKRHVYSESPLISFTIAHLGYESWSHGHVATSTGLPHLSFGCQITHSPQRNMWSVSTVVL